jgi:flagellin-like hook-associated protein FlgL
MDINRLATLDITGNYRSINNRLNGVLEKLGSGKRAATARQDPILWGDVQGLKDYATRLQSFSDNLNRGAASIRVALDTMDATKAQLSQLEERLRSARAAPEGSEDRARALRDYNTFHRFVDDLAQAPDPGARRLLDNPESFEDAGDLSIRAGENGFNIILRSREIHSGADGLNLPRVGEAAPDNPSGPVIVSSAETATDEELAEMIAYMERAKETLAARAKALSVDASAVEDAEGFNKAFVDRNLDQANALNIPDLEAEAVLSKAMTLKSSLAMFGLTGLNESKQLALRLLQ